ncbi:hypothetical protein GCM10023215_03430 [Pseudonocardia yuanmonensis]|uniref:ARB-07466-like C-terminal domain-containing protein n=1 Tax=Pseudonocardia yuanmonensis TaxID=1095914 RepID=A0ABP8VZ20_9PSEU
MSRHRSPAAGAPGRGTVDVRRLLAGTGAPPLRTRRQALRRGATAAAVTGGALAVVAPVASLLATDPSAVESTQVGLASADVVDDELFSADGAALAASVLPVRREADPPGLAAAENLLKSAGLNDAARRAEEERLAREARTNCDVDLSDLGAVKPWVRDAARFLSCLYDRPDLIGVAGRGRVSDHPTGRALDLMTTGAHGDRIAACALANREALGISYVIWEQRINYGDGWESMENRGNATENHFDHVHVSFERSSGSGTPDPDLCT